MGPFDTLGVAVLGQVSTYQVSLSCFPRAFVLVDVFCLDFCGEGEGTEYAEEADERK